MHLKLPLSFKYPVCFNQYGNEKYDAVKCLGVYIDDKLTWCTHVYVLSLQSAICFCMLYQLREFVNEHALLMLYCTNCLTYIRSIYGINSWAKATYTH